MTWSIYVDPIVGAPVVEGSTLKMCSGPLSNLVHALFTARETIEGLPEFGAGLWDVESWGPNAARDLERIIDRALESARGGWDRYERRVVLSREGVPVVEVTIQVGPERYTETLPLRRP